MKNIAVRRRGIIPISILAMAIFTGLLTQCGKEEAAPPDEIIEEARTKTEFIINKAKRTDETIKGTPELVKEYWDAEEQRYVLEYYVETVFGAAVTDSPTAYIVKESGGWKYQFTFNKPYESSL